MNTLISWALKYNIKTGLIREKLTSKKKQSIYCPLSLPYLSVSLGKLDGQAKVVRGLPLLYSLNL